jgi:hypothetical protein
MSNFVTFKVQMLFYFDCSKLIKFNWEPTATPTNMARYDHVVAPMHVARQEEGSSPCQRGGPAATLHVARQSGPAAPRGPARANGLDLQIKFR